MPIWKVTDDGPESLRATQFAAENVVEANIENWIASDPSILMEPLLIIGRQVVVQGVGDRLDLLALDLAGNAVIIELKRGAVGDPVDMQALRYASYISRWRYTDIEQVARGHLAGDEDFSLSNAYEEFCSEAGIDEAPDINGDQRIIIAGHEVRDRLGSVALWLREHSVDITLIEIGCYAGDQGLLLAPRVLVPHQVSRFDQVGKPPGGDPAKPWLAAGRAWHMETRCGSRTAPMLRELDRLVRETVEVGEPSWRQKGYVSYPVRGYNWLYVDTHAGMLSLGFLVEEGSFAASHIAERLGIEEFDREASMGEKMGLPSSVMVRPQRNGKDKVTLRLKEDFEIGTEEFASFIRDAYNVFYR